LCPQNQKILSTNHHYGNPSTRFSVEPLLLIIKKIPIYIYKRLS
jgi:hypothetical protein